MSSTIQREIKALVDQLLKTSETKSLRFTRVSIKASDNGFEVNIKIYLEHPIRSVVFMNWQSQWLVSMVLQ